MPPAAAPEGQERSTAASVARRASKAPRSVLTAEDVLAATGCRSFDALLCASLPSHGIASLSPSFTSLHKLCDLDVSGNLLADLSALAPLPSLRRLNVAGNCLALPWPAPDAGGSTRTPAGWFPSLEWLDLSYNQLEPEALLLLQRLPRLRELDISGNALQALPALDGGAFSALHRLAAGHNDLADGALAALAGLPLLQQLVLQHNRVGELPLLPPAAFARLELLDVSHNRLADVAAVQRLQRLPSIQRLLLAGCPVARAGFGAAGTLAGTLHQAQAGAGRGGRGGPAGAGGSRAGKPSLAQTFQFSAVVEEASAVSLRAKGLARRGSTASSAAGTASMHSSATTSACPTRPGTGGPAEGGSVPATALPPAVPASVTAQPQADGSTTTKAGAEGGEAAAGVSLIDWPEDIDSSEGEGDSDSWHAQCADWSTGSAHGSGSTADDAMLSLEGDSSDDPTMRLALALGLDPLLLPAAGGPGMAGSPAAAVKALRFALAHPSSTPSLSAGPASGGNHHLAMTAATLAKQRRKAGQGGQQGTGAGSRLQQIDGMLAAMKRRLRAVQAAMAADLEKAREAEDQQQKQEQQALGAIEERFRSPRPAGDMQQQPQEGNEEAQGAATTLPLAPDGQPILQLSTSGKHTQAHNLLVNMLAGLPAQSDRPASRGAAHPTSPAVTNRSGAAQGSPRVKRPRVVATELHAFADALKERQ